MRIIAFSDTHKRFDVMLRIVEDNKDAGMFIFLGDGERELDDLRSYYPNTKILNVSGNCDFNSMAKSVDATFSEGKKILFLHGHMHNVKYGTQGIVKLAHDNNADIVLFGHTHQRYCSYEDGVYVFNPGSAGQPRDGKAPSYGFIDITKAGIVCGHKEL